MCQNNENDKAVKKCKIIEIMVKMKTLMTILIHVTFTAFC